MHTVSVDTMVTTSIDNVLNTDTLHLILQGITKRTIKDILQCLKSIDTYYWLLMNDEVDNENEIVKKGKAIAQDSIWHAQNLETIIPYLKPREREVIRMRYLSTKKYKWEEIGQALNYSTSRVKEIDGEAIKELVSRYRFHYLMLSVRTEYEQIENALIDAS